MLGPEPPHFIRFVNQLTGHVIDGEGCPSVPSPTHVTGKNVVTGENAVMGPRRKRSNEIITSYDVSALFTSIPPDDAIQVVRNCLIKDVNLSDRTDLTVE